MSSQFPMMPAEAYEDNVVGIATCEVLNVAPSLSSLGFKSVHVKDGMFSGAAPCFVENKECGAHSSPCHLTAAPCVPRHTKSTQPDLHAYCGHAKPHRRVLCSSPVWRDRDTHTQTAAVPRPAATCGLSGTSCEAQAERMQRVEKCQPK